MICIVVLGTCQCLQAYPQLLMCALTVTLDNHIVYLILIVIIERNDTSHCCIKKRT